MRRWTSLLLAATYLLGGLVLGALAHKNAWPIYMVPRDLARRWLGMQESPQKADPSKRKDGTHFRLARMDDAAPSESNDAVTIAQSQIEALEALGYAAGTQEVTADGGVEALSDDEAVKGLYVATDGHAPVAWLMDEQGKVLHRWSKAFDEAFPENTVPESAPGVGYFRRVALLPDGALLAVYEGQGLIKLDAASNLVWAYDALAHHDVEVQPDGTIYTLTRKAHIIENLDPDKPILEDFVTHLSADGKVLSSFSVLDAVRNSPFRSLYMNSHRTGDAFHTNSLEVLTGDVEYKHPAFRPGNILLSLCHSHAAILVDPKIQRAVWSVSGLMRKQHHPTMLPNGNMMVFDNLGDMGKSRVLEIDTMSGQIAWEYSGQQHDLFTPCCGTAQRLPTGHTLITESENGRALIVTEHGETVWQYRTPNRAGPKREYIATLFDVFKLPANQNLTWLKSR